MSTVSHGSSVAEWLASSPQIPRYDKELLLCARLHRTRAELFTHPDHPVSCAEADHLQRDFAALSQGMPLAYVLGEWEFYGLTLSLSQDVLIPRPDTELLVDLCLERLARNATVLELGTGSGAIAIALKKNRSDLQLTASDISAEALAVAAANAEINAVSVQFVQSDWFQNISESYDAIISNPPYIAANDEHLSHLTHEPRQALVAADDGLADLKTISQQAPEYLHAGGFLLLEHGWQQGPATRDIMQQAGYRNITTFNDLAGHERATQGYLGDGESPGATHG